VKFEVSKQERVKDYTQVNSAIGYINVTIELSAVANIVISLPNM
jgi:hypothetical protein